MTKIEEGLYEIFGDKLLKSINQDEAVAQGAAIYARSIMDGKSKDLFEDVSSLSMGILVADGIMSVLIKRFTKIPCCGVDVFSTVEDNQEQANIQVYEGEDFKHCKNNKFIDNAIFKGLTPKPKGECNIEIKLQIDENGIIQMNAKETESNNSLEVSLSRPGLLSNKKIDELVSKYTKMEEKERVSKNIDGASNSLKNYIDNMERKIKNNEIGNKNKKRIENKIKSIKDFIKEEGEENIPKGQIEKWKYQLEQMNKN